jgi:hypothetical protein
MLTVASVYYSMSGAKLPRCEYVVRDAAAKVPYAPVGGFASRELSGGFSEQVIAALHRAQPQVFAVELCDELRG